MKRQCGREGGGGPEGGSLRRGRVGRRWSEALEGLRGMALGAREERRARGSPGGGAGGYFCIMGKW